jgi:hypothetical protein
MKSTSIKVLLATAMLFATGLATSLASAMDRPYTEGPVTQISYIKIKPGMFDAYLKWIATDRKALMEEYKKAGLIVSWKVYSAEARSPHEADVILTVTYKNWAALDGLQDKQDPIVERLQGSNDKQNQAVIGREQMREVLGTSTIQELVIK